MMQVSNSFSIPIELLESASRPTALKSFPVQGGLVFPPGEIPTAIQGAIVDDLGTTIPSEQEVTGVWNDGPTPSVRWLLVRFRADAGRAYTFQPTGSRPLDTAMGQVMGGNIVVDTGSIRISVPSSSTEWNLGVYVGTSRKILAGGGPMLETSLGMTTNGAWEALLEQNDSLQSTICLRAPLFNGNSPAADLVVRLVAYAGESFFRVYHTIIWKVRPVTVKIVHFGFGLNVDSQYNQVSVGRLNAPWTGTIVTPDTKLQALQRDVSSPDEGNPRNVKTTFNFQAQNVNDDDPSHAISGAASLSDTVGNGCAVSLRDACQLYPSGFTFEQGKLQLDLWPDLAPPGGFDYEDMVPGFLYRHPIWAMLGLAHADSEYRNNSYFEQTAEGSSRTHEFTVLINTPAATRTAEEIHDLTQHPAIIRQAPSSAMRVPVFGIEIPAKGSLGAASEDIERAIDVVGKLSTTRWYESFDYGFWRFGMQRWGLPVPPLTGENLVSDTLGGKSLYRWCDGVQYDQPFIPWLLFMRGGDRSYYIEGERTGRFATDVATNSFNTRGYAPGYEASASVLSYPWLPQHFNKALKLHHLQYYYHLTLYPLAKDMMNLVIDSALAAYHDPKEQPVLPMDSPRRGPHAREFFTVNFFWPAVWEERHDDASATHSTEWAAVMPSQFDRDSGMYASPDFYAVSSSIYQDKVFDRSILSSQLLQHIDAIGLGPAFHGGLAHPESAIAAPWAYQKTGDIRYIARHARHAEEIADTIPNLHPSGSFAQREWPLNFVANSFYHGLLAPMLTGLSSMRLLGSSSTQAVNRTLLVYAAVKTQPINFTVKVPASYTSSTTTLSLLARASVTMQPTAFDIRDSSNTTVASAVLDASSPHEAIDPTLFASSVNVNVSPGTTFTVVVTGANAESQVFAGLDTELPYATKKASAGGDWDRAVAGKDGVPLRVYLKRTALASESFTVWNAQLFSVRTYPDRHLVTQSILPLSTNTKVSSTPAGSILSVTLSGYIDGGATAANFLQIPGTTAVGVEDWVANSPAFFEDATSVASLTESFETSPLTGWTTSSSGGSVMLVANDGVSGRPPAPPASASIPPNTTVLHLKRTTRGGYALYRNFTLQTAGVIEASFMFRPFATGTQTIFNLGDGTTRSAWLLMDTITGFVRVLSDGTYGNFLLQVGAFLPNEWYKFTMIIDLDHAKVSYSATNLGTLTTHDLASQDFAEATRGVSRISFSWSGVGTLNEYYLNDVVVRSLD